MRFSLLSTVFTVQQYVYLVATLAVTRPKAHGLVQVLWLSWRVYTHSTSELSYLHWNSVDTNRLQTAHNLLLYKQELILFVYAYTKEIGSSQTCSSNLLLYTKKAYCAHANMSKPILERRKSVSGIRSAIISLV